jgi:N-methylhydantoinase B
MMCQVAFGGTDPRSGDLYAFYETIAGGYGGRHSSDGPDAVQAHGQNTENAPVEETEGSYPVRILRYELIPDSEGPGRQRGGLGLRRDYAFPDHNPTFTILADQDKTGPWGLFGGRAAPPARYVVNPEGEARSLGSRTTVELHPGDVVSIQSCGGGGYGPASKRNPEQVLADVQAGKISLHRSREEYRVIIDAETGQVDSPATQKLRAQRETEGATRSTAPPTSPDGQGGGR